MLLLLLLLLPPPLLLLLLVMLLSAAATASSWLTVEGSTLEARRGIAVAGTERFTVEWMA